MTSDTSKYLSDKFLEFIKQVYFLARFDDDWKSKPQLVITYVYLYHGVLKINVPNNKSECDLYFP